MEMTGEYRISATRENVWAALNDPDILRLAIPGCQTMEKLGETRFTATVQAKVGPVKAKFKGEVELSELNPPVSYIISGEGKGGAAGFAKGGAKVNLAEDGTATLLRYDVNARVGGKLAQIGQRLIDSAAKKMANDFFKTFSELVESDGSPDQELDQVVTSSDKSAAATHSDLSVVTAPPREQHQIGLSSWAWMGGLILAVLLVVALADRLPF